MSYVCEKCDGSGRRRISEMSTLTEPCPACKGLGVQDPIRLLGEIARVLGKELIRGHAMSARPYSGERYWDQGYHRRQERQVRVYLERAPRGSRPVFLLVEKREEKG